MIRVLRFLLLGILCVSFIGCSGQPAAPVIDPAESKAKEEEINKAMEQAMQEQMQGKGSAEAPPK